MAGTDTWRATLRTYYCIKFSLSFYSTLFSLIGLLILCIGIYAESERRKHQTLEGIFLAPAIILLLLGMLMFVVSFIGMVGSLRDNLLLLKIFFWVLLVIFLVEILLIVIELVCENEMKKFAHANILAGLKHYYDDLDFKNIMDFVQEKFSCCGGDQFTDWMVNPYHSCNSSGPLSCGVPYTCCITGTSWNRGQTWNSTSPFTENCSSALTYFNRTAAPESGHYTGSRAVLFRIHLPVSTWPLLELKIVDH
ncbi:tetraspanin-15-like isoform X2 [Phyllobates terribilis]|uniref:tetraspanin-15-like isoform X2 n=1 Tax=Phyllobates terribilis TaxID=111132 RepID=UPI003CCA87F9